MTGPRCRFGTVYSPFSAKPYMLQLFLWRPSLWTVHLQLLFLFFCKWPGPVSHITRLKFNNTISLFSTKFNYILSTFKETIHVIYNLLSRVISTPQASTNPTEKTGFPKHVPQLPMLSNEQEWSYWSIWWVDSCLKVKTASQVFRGISCLITHQYRPVNLNNTYFYMILAEVQLLIQDKT